MISPRKFTAVLRYSLAIMLMLIGQQSWAGAGVNTGFFNNTAIKGYDPVAYFTEGKPVKGDKQFTVEYQGADWYFASAENKAKFEKSPDMFAPQYGGYCAYAVAQGKTAGIDPDQWSIVDGKLYLNYNAAIQNKWLGKRDQFIVDADREWPEIR